MNLFDLHRGNGPLIVDIPHAGTHLPADIAARLTPIARTMPDTDWQVDKLYAFVRDSGVPYRFDPERAAPLVAVLKRRVAALIDAPAAMLMGADH